MTEEEFYAITRKGKRHLLLLDDLVLDGTDYAPYHPGGKFIIERTRGTDISKFFYGGYNLEPQNNGTNYNHTNYARMACNGLIIAKLVRGVNTGLVKIAQESLASQDQMIKTFKFVAAPGTTLSKHIAKHFPIDWTGKHYLMQEKRGDRYVGNIRHYTVSNCMAADSYADYCKALESHIAVKNGENQKIYRMQPALLSTQPSTDFSLTLKVYWEAKGFSARMFESSTANDGATWMVKGPMGKSLGVQRSGNHIAFAAGTGAITFMDLSAYVARFIMGEMDEKEKS